MDKERIERRSRRGARFTLVGYLVTILAFIMMYFLMSKGQGRVRVLTNVIDVQDKVIDRLRDSISNATVAPCDDISTLTPYAKLINYEAVSGDEQIRFQYDNACAEYMEYNFILWMNGPAEALSQVDSVSYMIYPEDYPKRGKEVVVSKSRVNGFATEYIGHCCLRIDYTIHGKTDNASATFDLCKYLDGAGQKKVVRHVH